MFGIVTRVVVSLRQRDTNQTHPTPLAAKLVPLPQARQPDLCRLLVRPSTRSRARSLRTHHSPRSPATDITGVTATEPLVARRCRRQRGSGSSEDNWTSPPKCRES